VNDVAPEFNATALAKTIPENAVGGLEVGQLQHIDPDTGDGGVAHFYVHPLSDEGYFAVDKLTGLITTTGKSFDYETVQEHSVSFRLVDGGTPALEAVSLATLRVTLTDYNDNAPAFAAALYRFNLLETRAIGSVLGTLLAVDDDKPATAASNVNYRLVAGADPRFIMQYDTGDIVMGGKFDFDTIDKSFSFFAEAYDLGDPSLSSRATIQVTVQDANDNDPQIDETKLYGRVLSEDAAPGTFIDTVVATDADSGDNGRISFFIVGGTGQGLFTIGGSSGVITSSANFDYDGPQGHQELLLTVIAADNGVDELGQPSPRWSVPVNVTIDIDDVNDNGPKFEKNLYVATVPELAAQAEVVTVTATDLDSGINSIILYSLVDSPEFEINPATGRVSLRTDPGAARAKGCAWLLGSMRLQNAHWTPCRALA